MLLSAELTVGRIDGAELVVGGWLGTRWGRTGRRRACSRNAARLRSRRGMLLRPELAVRTLLGCELAESMLLYGDNGESVQPAP